MAYFSPQQRQHDRRWDYVCQDRQGTYPIGYCHKYREWLPSHILIASDAWRAEESKRLNEKYSKLRHNFHEDGHATAEEAVACYRKYQLDTQLRFSDKPDENEQRRCEICKEWTQHAGWLEEKYWALCKNHQNRASIERLFVGQNLAWTE